MSKFYRLFLPRNLAQKWISQCLATMSHREIPNQAQIPVNRLHSTLVGRRKIRCVSATHIQCFSFQVNLSEHVSRVSRCLQTERRSMDVTPIWRASNTSKFHRFLTSKVFFCLSSFDKKFHWKNISYHRLTIDDSFVSLKVDFNFYNFSIIRLGHQRSQLSYWRGCH